MNPERFLTNFSLRAILFALIGGLLVIVAITCFSAKPNKNTIHTGTPFYPSGSRVEVKADANTELTNSFISNPAAVYCTDLGYQFTITEDEAGQRGLCTLPGNIVCDAWDFLQGTCGQAYSYCAKQGYKIKLKSDGQDPFTRQYSVCTTASGSEVGSVVILSSLQEKITQSNCSNSGNQTAFPQKSIAPIAKSTLQPVSIPSAPSLFDWRNYLGQNWLTSVKDQSGCGSCWAFAAVGAVEAAHNIGNNDPDIDLDLSEEYLVSDCTNAGTCCGGWSNLALQYIRDQGLPDESCMPYVDGSCVCGTNGCSSSCTYKTDGNCSNRTCSNRCSDWNSRLTKVDEFGYVSPNISAIKQSLIDIGPVVVYMGIGNTYGGYWDGDIYRCMSDTEYNHAVVVVGYDDSGGYWIVRNSWGTGWNDNGYFKVGYRECMVEAHPLYAKENQSMTTLTPSATPTMTSTPGGASCFPAMSLSCGNSDTYSNAWGGSTNQISLYNCSSWNESGPEYTYQFIPNVSGQVTVSLSNLSADLDIFVLNNATGSCSEGNCIAHGNDSASFTSTAGQIYYLVVDGYVGAVGNYTISVQCDETETPTPTSTSTVTSTPTGPQVRVINAWTSDEYFQPKTTFYPGDVIRWILDVENLTGADAQITMTYEVEDPNGLTILYWNGPVTTDPGVWGWYLESTVSAGNGGMYMFDGSGLYGGLSSYAMTTYFVDDPTPTPTSTSTKTSTPTITPTATLTFTPTATHTSTSTFTRTSTSTETCTSTSTATRTSTSTATRTTTPTLTPTSTQTPTATITPTTTPTQVTEYKTYLPMVIR